jgi:hypothetical protein
MIVQTSNHKVHLSASAFEPLPVKPTGGAHAQLQVYQKQQVDSITETVRLQRVIGNQIIQEIDEQHKMIIEIDEGIEDAHTAMKQVTRLITRLIESEGKVPTYVVAVLSAILVLMLWWVA